MRLYVRLCGLALLLILAVQPAHASYFTDRCRDELPEGYVPITKRLASGEVKSLLYRLERCKHPTSYVFGTFHSDSPTLDPIYKQAVSRIELSTRLILEIVTTKQSQKKALSTMLLPSMHPGLHALIPMPMFDKAVAVLGPILNQGPDTLNRYTPWALALIVQYPAPERDGVVLDQRLQDAAKERGKRLFGLETIDEQLGLFTALTAEEQQQFLQVTLDNVGELQNQFKELSGYYLSQDIVALEAMSERLFNEMATRYPTLASKLLKGLVYDRNALMARRALPHLTNQAFIAVGALHLPGEKGLLSLLEAEGFAIYPEPSDR